MPQHLQILATPLNVTIFVGAVVDILADSERVLKGLCFQDLEMQRRYKAYPEMISVNATYKLLEIRMPVYLILNEDAMGESEIVAVCFLAEENAEGVGFFIDSL